MLRGRLASLCLLSVLLSCGGSDDLDDPLAPQQWHLRNDGRRSFGDALPSAGVDLHIGRLHAQGIRGRGVLIGLADLPVDAKHEDLAANVIAPAGDATEPPSTHGTALAGILVASGWNGIGGRGVAPEAKLLDLSRPRDASMKPQVINLSQGSAGRELDPDGLAAVKDLESTWEKEADKSILVKAAGNDFRTIANYPNSAAVCADATRGLGVSCLSSNFDLLNAPRQVIVVASVNARGVRSSTSSTGSSNWISGLGGESGFERAIAGPQADDRPVRFEPAIVTTDVSGCDAGLHTDAQQPVNALDRPRSSLDPACNYTARANGTSAAAPTVTGVIALMLQVNPEIGTRGAKYLLATTARRIDPDLPNVVAPGGLVLDTGWTRNAADRWFSNAYGFGLVDATAAVEAARTFRPFGPLRDLGWQRSIGAARSIESGGVTIESVQLAVQTKHTDPSRLKIVLVSPSGSRSIVLHPHTALEPTPGGFRIPIMSSNAFLDEGSAGRWSLDVVDVDASKPPPVVEGWQLRVVGRDA